MTDEKPDKTKNGTLIAIIIALAIVAMVVLKPKPQPGATMAHYVRIRAGMNYSEVVGVVGSPGVETTRGELAGIVTVIYTWPGEDPGTHMNVMFQDGKLITKAQSGLK